MEKLVENLTELEAEAARFASSLAPSPRGATLVTLSGDLGAGKTAFTKAVAQVLGVKEAITSPTFVLEKIYQLVHAMSPFKRLVHIDAYRLESGSDLAPLGFDELMQDTSNLILLEWPEKVQDALPIPAVQISLVVQAGDIRLVSYSYA